MIIKGQSCAGSGRLAAHLLRTDQNERVDVREPRGSAALELRGALADMEALAAGLRCKRPLYHASINTRLEERLSEDQRMIAIDRLEAALGLAGQPRAVVVHSKLGREHTHVVWSRAVPEQGRVISDSHNYRKHEAVARALEREFGHASVPGVHVGRRGRDRPERSPDHHEMQQALRSGIRPAEARAQITALWRGTETGQQFAAALKDVGWTLCRGDRREFVLMDAAGCVHSLARRIEGATAKDIRARMADIDPARLPSVKEARAAIRATSPQSKTVVPFPRPSSHGQKRQPVVDQRGGKVGGLFVTVSRQRLDYSRPLMQPGANSNAPPRPSPARLAMLGGFRGVAMLTTTPHAEGRVERLLVPARPAALPMNEPVNPGGPEANDELDAAMHAIEFEVERRTMMISGGISTDYAARIRAARQSLPRDQVAGAVAALKQMRTAALKVVKDSAANEVRDRQKMARVLMRRGRIRSADRTISREHPDF